MEPFGIIDMSGDIGIAISGESLPEVFAKAGLALYQLTTDRDAVREELFRGVHVEAETCDALLVRFLNELIYLFEAESLVGRSIEVDTLHCEPEGLGPASVHARVRGEEFSPERHGQRLLLKAATYHKLRLEQVEGQWHAEVIFDI
jgi:SHS2 domain-containing protein